MNRSVRIDLADNCNLRCVMCQAYNSMAEGRLVFADIDLFKRRLSGQLRDWDVIQLGNVSEPLTHPRFDEFLAFVRGETDAEILIVTNGLLLERHAPAINAAGHCRVMLSLDSIRPEVYETIRVRGSFERAMQGLAALDRSRCGVLLAFTLMASNIGEYADAAAFCGERGYRMSAFPMMMREELRIVPYRLVRESLVFNRAALRRAVDAHFGNTFGGVLQGSALGAVKSSITAGTCMAHEREFMIDARGQTTLCYQVNSGNLATADLAGLRNGPVALEFRREVETTRTPCQSCNFMKRCLTPSVLAIENHFSEPLCDVIGPEVLQRLSFDSPIGDGEAADLFVRTVGDRIGIYDIEEHDRQWTARRVVGVDGDDLQPRYAQAPPLGARTRDLLHQHMIRGLTTGEHPAAARLQHLVAGWTERRARVVVFGAGQHTRDLLERTRLADAPIVGVVDSNPALHGTLVDCHRIDGPDALPALQPDVVLISSRAFEAEMRQAAAGLVGADTNIVTLYP